MLEGGEGTDYRVLSGVKDFGFIFLVMGSI